MSLNPLAPPRPAPLRPAPARPAPRRARRDPAPSRLAYRLQRMWLTPLYRRLLRLGLPVFLVCLTAGVWLSDDGRRAALRGSIDNVLEEIRTRDEFMVTSLRIDGASPDVERGLRAMLPLKLPASSFDIDLNLLRSRVARLDAVESVDLRILPGGTLSAVVVERVPVLLWRHARGIELIDRSGHRVVSVTSREMRPDLPMIAGEGADAAAAEALALLDAAGPILPRLRGLERIGARRWDLVLADGPRVMLPSEGALAAMETVMRWQKDDVLGRDITAIDLRNPGRPVLRLGLPAQNALRRAQGLAEVDADGNVVEPAEPAARAAPAKPAKAAKPAKKKT